MFAPDRQAPRGCRRLRRVFLLAGLLCYGLALAPSIAHAAPLRQLVEFVPGTPTAVQQALVAASGSTLVRRLPLVNAAAVKLPATSSDAALSYLRSRPEVRNVYVDPALSAQAEVDPEGAESQLISPAPAPANNATLWNLQHSNVYQVDPSYRGQNVHVAVVDTGIDATHPALIDRVVGGYNAVTSTSTLTVTSGEGGDGEGGDGEGGDGEGGDGEGGDGEGGDGEGGDGVVGDPNNYHDCNGHGTHIAGLIAGDTVGVAPQAKLYAVRVLNCQGGGYVSDLISGLSWVYEQPQIRVINMSLGFYKTSPYPLLHQAIKALNDAGKILVAAVGNYRADCFTVVNGVRRFTINPLGCNTRVKFPARYPEIIAVAAHEATGAIASYSISGPEVDLTAPGGSHLQPILSTTTLNSTVAIIPSAYGYASGTSMAAPHVTGVLARMLSAQPNLTPAAARVILQSTATSLSASASAQGYGRLNAAAAVTAAQTWNGRSPTTVSPTLRRQTSIDATATFGNYVLVESHAVVQAGSRAMDYAKIKKYVTIGSNSTLGEYAVIEDYAHVGTNTTIGHHTVLEEHSLVGATGEDLFGTTIGDYSLIRKRVVIGTNVRIGNNTVLQPDTTVGNRTTIGNGTLIKTRVVISADVTIGNHVVIGKHAVVCSGVVIPDNTVIVSNARVGTCS